MTAASSGILVVDKTAGATSFDAVARGRIKALWVMASGATSRADGAIVRDRNPDASEAGGRGAVLSWLGTLWRCSG